MSGTHRSLPLRTPAKWLIMLVLLAAVAAPLLAQSTTATIRGKVTDSSGAPVPAADVIATSTTSGFTYTATTRADGGFNLGGLTPGSFVIVVAAPGSEVKTQEVTVLVGQTLDLNFGLRPEMVVTESITVVGSTLVETRTEEVATNITRMQIETLPQGDRNFLNFAALAPGVLLGTDEMRKEIRAGAQSSSATNVFIDGVSFKNDVIQGGVVGQDASRGNPFPQNAVQEFRVITQNYSAEYQKASSAIITAITRSGSNDLRGDLFAYYQDKSLVADNPMTGANPEYERMQWGVSVGGPIMRDKMHYFLSYEANDQDREETVTLGGGWQDNPALRNQLSAYQGVWVSPFRSDLAFGKMSYQPAGNQIADLSFNYRSETDIRNFGGTTSREAAEDVQNDVWGTTLRHQYTSTSWLNEASISFQDFAWNPQPLDRNQVGQEWENLLRIGGRDTEQNIGQERLAFRDDITFSGIQAAGLHTLKVGANMEFLDYTIQKFQVGNPVYYYKQQYGATIPYKARYGFGDPDMSNSNTQYGIYAQDDWAIGNKLLLNLGLRWDYETDMLNTDYVTPAEVRERLGDDFPSKYFTDGNDRSPATDMWQPRLGFSYDVFETGHTVVFGGVGRFYDRVLFNNTLDEQFRLQWGVREFFFSADGSDVEGQPAVQWNPSYMTPEGLNSVIASGRTGKPEVFLIENDTKVPYSDQWNLGVRQSFGNYVASATYSNIRSKNGISFLWGKGFCCPQVDPNYSNILISSDDVKTWYDAVFLQFDRPFTADANYGFNIAYTWSDAEQIGGDLFSLDLPTISDWPRYGTPGTQDHRIVASGIVGIPWDMRLSTLIQYSSGDKFRINDFSRGWCTGCYNPRTGEGPSWQTMDLRLEKDFLFGGDNRFGVILEAFNVFNEERYAGYQDFVPPEGNPNIGVPWGIITGSQRRYQVGLRYGF